MNQKLASAMFLIGVVALTACNPQDLIQSRNRRVTPIPIDLPVPIQQAVRDYDFLVGSLRALYFKPDKVGKDWQKLTDDERAKLLGSDDPQQLGESIRKVIDAIGDEDITLQASETSAPKFGGIGVLVDLPSEGKDRILILSVYPDSPADRAGIKPHDAIIAVEGEPIDWALGAAPLLKIRGEPDTKVNLTIRTPGQEPRDISIARKINEPNTPLVSRKIDNTNISYIAPDPTRFENMREDTAMALRSMSQKNQLDGIILDLRTIRGNEFPANDMLSLFVNGEVGKLKLRPDQPIVDKIEKIDIRGKSVGGSQSTPMVILVSDLTSGEAEAFAGLLQELGRAKVIGNKTRGRTAQLTKVLLPVSRLELFVPTAEYLSAKNRSWYEKGIEPNVTTESVWEDFSEDDDPQLKEAIATLSK
jgi:carboxyl-terminal processing protease